MQKRMYTLAATLLALSLLLSATALEWGFFGHRRINRMAVFT